jgi:capsular polysaccharide biosynthesis protein
MKKNFLFIAIIALAILAIYFIGQTVVLKKELKATEQCLVETEQKLIKTFELLETEQELKIKLEIYEAYVETMKNRYINELNLLKSKATQQRLIEKDLENDYLEDIIYIETSLVEYVPDSIITRLIYTLTTDEYFY